MMMMIIIISIIITIIKIVHVFLSRGLSNVKESNDFVYTECLETLSEDRDG